MSLGWMLTVVIATTAAIIGNLVFNDSMGRPEPPFPTVPLFVDHHRAAFTLCSGPVRANCVVDGDTFWFRGEKIRISDIDAPEVSAPRCAAEAELGELATLRLLDLLNAGGFSLVSGWRDEDRYGRKLRIVSRHGQSLGEILVGDGLARRWDCPQHNWCA